MITWDDFKKIDIRVGTIIEIKKFDMARKPAFKLKIDFGPLGIKKSSAQITTLYSESELLQKQVLAVINFPPKQIANFLSEVLVLGLINEKNNEVILLQPDRKVENGLRVA
ncbi:tRNA-binding protein [Candidatus Hodarchaeum mangrovi]